MEKNERNKSSGNYEFKWTGYDKYKTFLGGGHEGPREGPEEKGRRIFPRICTWGNLTPLAEIGAMRKR